MTYKQLLAALKELSEDELELTATIYSKNDDQYWIAEFTDRSKFDDVIERDHPIIVFNDKGEWYDLDCYI